jgi:ribosome assembly protein 4
MATLLPPPKRPKLYHGVTEPEPEPLKVSPNVVVQFVNEHDGTPIAPAVNLPANIAREGLEVLVNQLRTKVRHLRSVLSLLIFWVIQDDDEHVPFAFHVALPEEATTPNAPTRIVISKSIEVDVLSHASHAFSEEDVLVVRCAPQSVFKVRPATRCSATLSGLLIFPWNRSIIINVCQCNCGIRTFLTDIVRFILPYWQFTCDWFG